MMCSLLFVSGVHNSPVAGDVRRRKIRLERNIYTDDLGDDDNENSNGVEVIRRTMTPRTGA